MVSAALRASAHRHRRVAASARGRHRPYPLGACVPDRWSVSQRQNDRRHRRQDATPPRLNSSTTVCATARSSTTSPGDTTTTRRTPTCSPALPMTRSRYPGGSTAANPQLRLRRGRSFWTAGALRRRTGGCSLISRRHRLIRLDRLRARHCARASTPPPSGNYVVASRGSEVRIKDLIKLASQRVL